MSDDASVASSDQEKLSKGQEELFDEVYQLAEELEPEREVIGFGVTNAQAPSQGRSEPSDSG